jgi:NhaP-type Na+/H+ or K+/H+ antiporter
MNGFIILTSVVFIAYIVYRTTKNKIMKYVLTPIISLLYGVMLLFVGMGINALLFYALAIIPVIFSVAYIIKTAK